MDWLRAHYQLEDAAAVLKAAGGWKALAGQMYSGGWRTRSDMVNDWDIGWHRVENPEGGAPLYVVVSGGIENVFAARGVDDVHLVRWADAVLPWEAAEDEGRAENPTNSIAEAAKLLRKQYGIEHFALEVATNIAATMPGTPTAKAIVDETARRRTEYLLDRGREEGRARTKSQRRSNPALKPDELAQELADYLNTDIDPYDFGGYLLGRWQEEDPEQIDAAESRRGGGLVEQVDDLEDDERARFTRWLTKPGRNGTMSPLDEEMRDDALGVPSYLYFKDAKPLGKGAWGVHFTRHEFTSFERGATLEMLGLSTHWRKKADASCAINLDDSIGLSERVYGFAFAAETGRFAGIWKERSRKYGKRAVLFQTDSAVVAYHVTDDEHQVIFPLCSERNVHEVTFDTTGEVWLEDRGGGDPHAADDVAPFPSLLAATQHLDALAAKPKRRKGRR